MSGRDSSRAQEERICKICTGRATGYHFGVMSCEGCKGFFRRNVQKGARFICNYDKNCDVTGERRKNCQACRMAKCESTGMRRDRIMMGQRRKNRRTEERLRREAEKAAAEAAAAVEATSSPVSIVPMEDDGIVKTESPQMGADVPPSGDETKPLSAAIAKDVPSAFQYPDIKHEKCSPPLPIEPPQPHVISHLTPPPPQLIQQQFPPNMMQNFVGNPMQAGAFNNLFNAAVTWPTQFQYNRVAQLGVNFATQQSNRGIQHGHSQFISNDVFEPHQNQRNNNNYNIDQLFGNHFAHQQHHAPQGEPLLASPAISNSSPRSSAVFSVDPKTSQEQNSNESQDCPAGSSGNSTESSTLGVILAAKKAFDMENNYLMNARHHGFMAQQVQEKQLRDSCGQESPVESQMSSARYDRLASWLETSREYNDVSAEERNVNNHEPLTTPNGSLQSNERLFVQTSTTGVFDNFSMHSLNIPTGVQEGPLTKRTKFVEFLADLMEAGIKQIINYCKLIPEFRSLTLADQIQLLRNTILELLILKCYFDYKDGSFVNGSKGLWLYREDFLFATSDTSFIDSMMELMAKMAEINMTEEDTLLLMLVALFSDDRQNSCIADHQKIINARDHFLGIMERGVTNHPRDLRHTTQVLLLLPRLRTLNTSFMEVLKKVQKNKSIDMRTISKLIMQFDLKIDPSSGNGESSLLTV